MPEKLHTLQVRDTGEVAMLQEPDALQWLTERLSAVQELKLEESQALQEPDTGETAALQEPTKRALGIGKQISFSYNVSPAPLLT